MALANLGLVGLNSTGTTSEKLSFSSLKTLKTFTLNLVSSRKHKKITLKGLFAHFLMHHPFL